MRTIVALLLVVPQLAWADCVYAGAKRPYIECIYQEALGAAYGVAELALDVVGLGDRTSVVESDVSDLDSRASTLESGVSDLGSRASTLESDVSDLDSRASALESGVSDLGSRASALETSVSALQSASTAHSGTLSAHGAAISGLGSSVTALEDADADHDDRLASLEAMDQQLRYVIAGACLAGVNANQGSFVTETTTTGQTCSERCAAAHGSSSCAWGVTFWGGGGYYGYNYECGTPVNHQQSSAGYLCCCRQGASAVSPLGM